MKIGLHKEKSDKSDTIMVICQYTVFDQLKQRLLTAKQNTPDKGSSPEALSAFSAFVLGAISKSVATVLTYPAIRYMLIP